MATFKERLGLLRRELGLSLRQLSEISGVNRSTINAYENGRRMPKYENLEALADVFNCDVDYLLGKTDVKNVYANLLGFETLESAYLAGVDLSIITNGYKAATKKRLPLLGNVACGEPVWAEEERDVFVENESDLDADFCLTATGDSMINARIFDGDLLFIKKQPMVNDGEIAVVLIDNEATVKRVYYDRENNVLTLMPENPTFKPMRYQGHELEQITILGKVVAGQYKI